jgi:hypothetical protein
MSETHPNPAVIHWKCARCNAPLPVVAGARYQACAACGAAYRMQWRGGQIESHQAIADISRAMDPGISQAQIEERLLDSRQRLHGLNDRIRRLEMAKGGERLRVFAALVIICAAIYALFRLTVEGIDVFSNPGQVEYGLAAGAGLALLLLVFFRIRRGAIVRRVIRLHDQRTEIETELEAFSAALALRFSDAAESAPAGDSVITAEPSAAEPTPPTGEGDIIGRYATRKKEGRSRLNIRDEE